MTRTVAINVVGSEKGVKNILQMIYQSLDVSVDTIQRGSSRALAEFVAGLAKSNAPYSGRKGGIRDNITSERIANGRYRVYVKTPRRWGSDKSLKARHIYPLAQERAYKPHLIHTSMIPKEVRWKYLKGATEGGPGKNMGAEKGRFILVSGFKPYMLPAYIEGLQVAPHIMNAIIRRELKKLTKTVTKKYAKAGMYPGPLQILTPGGGSFPALATRQDIQDYRGGKRGRAAGWKWA